MRSPVGADPRRSVVTLGEALVLLAPTEPGPLRAGSELRLGVAGAELNVAVQLARLGHPVRWCGRLGSDALGDIVVDDLRAEGVGVDLVERDGGAPTGVYLKNTGQDGDALVHYYRTGSAASRTTVDVWERVAAVAPAIVHLSGITPALSASCLEAARVGLLDRPVPGALVSFDVNHRAALWRPGAAPDVLLALARAADLVLVGRDEAEQLWGTATADDVRRALPDVPTLVVKDGDVGATVFGEDRSFVPAPRVDVVEAVGAGDAFAAGYLHGVLSGWDAASSARAGHRLARAALTAIDDRGEPVDVDELDRAATGTSAGATRRTRAR